jgi:multicopper oxidase
MHPMYLHRHSFELVNVEGQPTSGVGKDVVSVPCYQTVELDVVADNPGRSLLHCHQQQHQDYGFRALVEYRWTAPISPRRSPHTGMRLRAMYQGLELDHIVFREAQCWNARKEASVATAYIGTAGNGGRSPHRL